METGWVFSKNYNGSICGIGEAGIETFKGSKLTSLAREVCQNSLDAILDTDKPVIIQFHEVKLSTTEIYGLLDLKDAIDRSIDFCKKINDNKGVAFFNKAQKVLNQKEISVLRVSDFNTTGLTGSDKPYGSAWCNLVKSNGVSDKNGNSGGSYGIGKSAPFASSELRTVFYSTYDKDGLIACQGVSRLVTFIDKDGDMTVGTGYFGLKTEKEKNQKIEIQPLRELPNLDKNYNRETSGTDIYILGFEYEDNWCTNIIDSLLDEYLVSIYENKLILEVGNTQISKTKLPELIEKRKEFVKYAYNYYQVLTSDQTKEFFYNIDNLGKLSFKVLLSPNFHRKVLVSRANGMKLFDKGNISSTVYFAGILRLIDEPLNDFFRQLEPPEHNSWEYERAEDSRLAKKRIKEINKFMKDKVLEMGSSVFSDEMDAEGVGDYLPDNISSSTNNENELIINNRRENFIDFNKTQIKIKESNIVDTGLENGESNIEKEIELIADVGEEGDLYPYFSDDNINLNEKEDDVFRLFENNSGNKNSISHIMIKNSHEKLFLRDFEKKEYMLVFEPSKNIEKGYIEVFIASEDNTNKVEVLKAKKICEGNKIEKKSEESKMINKIRNAFSLNKSDTINNIELKVQENKILIDNILSNEKTKVLFSIDFKELCALELKFYEYEE